MERKTIDETLIKNTVVYESIKSLITCSICQCILIDPQQCTCENVYCKECAAEWKKKSKECPMRCSDFTVKDTRLVKTLLSSLMFKCPKNCDKEFSYDEYFTHETSCDKATGECPCCKTIVPMKQINRKVFEENKKLIKQNEELKNEITRLNGLLGGIQINNISYIPNFFNASNMTFVTPSGAYLRTVTATNPLPSKFTIKLLLKTLKQPGHLVIGISDKIINERKGYIGGDFGKGNWGIAGNGSLGEEGKWGKNVGYKENDTLTLTGDNGVIRYRVNSENFSYSYNLGSKLLYFSISLYYEGEVIVLV